MGPGSQDLKPANCLLKSTVSDSRGFIVKLTDFGESRKAARGLQPQQLHCSRSACGCVLMLCCSFRGRAAGSKLAGAD